MSARDRRRRFSMWKISRLSACELQRWCEGNSHNRLHVVVRYCRAKLSEARDAEAAAAKDSPALGTASDASRSAKLSFSYRMRFLLPSFLHACFDRKDIVFAAGADR